VSRPDQLARAVARRRALGAEAVAIASAAVADRIAQLLEPAPAGRLGGYFAADGEIDPRPAVDDLRGVGWTAWFPALDPGPPAPMAFRRWDGAEPPPAGRYGLPTPPASAPACGARELDVVLVPLVLFGPAGARAGRGAGYYDRTFAWLRGRNRPSTPLLVGLGHDFQEVPELIPNPWDVALDAVVTPTRTLLVDAG
jgi:5-formyltetrahydrofolate cyclo-ligase